MIDFIYHIFTSDNYDLTRFLFQRTMGCMYLLVFIIALKQYRTLVGESGLLPIKHYLRTSRFLDAPSLFWINSSDTFILILTWCGLCLSALALTGISDSHGLIVSVIIWALLWIIYQSFVNTGQTFYGFGWEMVMLETGFLTIFTGSSSVKPSPVVMILVLWVLFRVMFGAGMIKIRGDKCWKDLTCMYYHYETQPLPNPLSWYFHNFPKVIHKMAILFNHFVELLVPWCFFAPSPVRYFAGGLIIIFQLLLILSGNLSWLNYITLVLCIPCFDDSILSQFININLPPAEKPPFIWIITQVYLVILVGVLSIRPVMNLISKYQSMNVSFDPLHLVNTYGAFGSISRERYEIILEGTDENVITQNTRWIEYEFKAKPGDINKMPPMISPYQLHLDWLMWFEAMQPYFLSSWFIIFIGRLLENDKKTLQLINGNPFSKDGPLFIRVKLYLYQFNNNRKIDSSWWNRKLIRTVLSPVSLKDEDFVEALYASGWLPVKKRGAVNAGFGE